MAVYTEIPDDELATFIASYGRGALTSYKGIAEGVENTNYLVHTEEGTFILTLYEKRVRRQDLPFFLALMEYLAGRGISCPTPVHDNEGRVLRELMGRPAALVTFLEGLSVCRPQPSHCAALGAGLAELHVAGVDFLMRRANSLSVGDWRRLFETFGRRSDEIAPGLGGMIEDELCHLEAHWPVSLPEGIIHADLFPDNVFFLGTALSGLIDFYFACTDMLAYDIAIGLNAWCFESDYAFNITKARALLRAYDRVRPLRRDELEALPVLARGAALRFLLTRTHDWLDTPSGALVRPKDPLEYLRKLRFHQGVRTVGEYGLGEVA